MTAEAGPRGAGWSEALRRHARRHRSIAIGLGAALLAMAALVLGSLVELLLGGASDGLRLGFLGGLAGFAATALGAAPALAMRTMPQKLSDMLLGGAAGMMLAASAFSLIIPGLDAGQQLTGSRGLSAAIVVFGMGLGVLLMLGLDEFTPHEHETVGLQGPGSDRVGRIWLFVFAIALHNLPEGMAIGVGFSHADMTVGLPLTTAIALQDMPEGLAVALALRGVGYTPGQAVLMGVATGLMEPVGAILGVGLSGGLAIAYPTGLGLAAGAMIFVVSHEVIPETHRNGHQTPATVGLMAGFALMMALDTTLG
ncbi:MAG: ZIP family metal transporter [Hyphomicrobiales bacterium]|nr:ZIP family metal transporter [Hyphomicrobiales bacterium]